MKNRLIAVTTNILLLLFGLLALGSGVKAIVISHRIANGIAFTTACPCNGVPNTRSGIVLIIISTVILLYYTRQEWRSFQARKLKQTS